jgi:hypothetical protein
MEQRKIGALDLPWMGTNRAHSTDVAARRRKASRLRWATRFVWTALALTAACIQSPSTQLGPESPYTGLIGTEYRVVGDVKAYGIYEGADQKKLAFVTLIPGVGIGGREVAFGREVKRGQVIRLLSAWHRPVLGASDIYYLVAAEGTNWSFGDWDRDVPIRVELMRGNEGVGPELNTAIYRRIEKGTR